MSLEVKVKENVGFYNVPPSEENLVENKLSIETMQQIFLNLGDPDLRQARLVNRRWNDVSIDRTSHQEFSSIKGFVSFVCHNLGNSHADQKKQLLDIVNGTEILNSLNLYQVKSSMDEMKETILSILKKLDNATLKNLEELSKNEATPTFFQDVFSLAGIYKKIDEANAILDEVDKSSMLQDIVDALLEKDKIEKGAEIAGSIPDGDYKALAFWAVVDALLKEGNLEKAIKMVGAMPNRPDLPNGSSLKSSSLRSVSGALFIGGRTQEAIEMANTISDETQKEKVFSFMRHMKELFPHLY